MDTYKDKWGYDRYKKEFTDLVHRRRVYHIYLENRKKYPLPFSAYEVHHKDFDKTNNKVSNLMIVTPTEHDRIHEEERDWREKEAEAIKRENEIARIKRLEQDEISRGKILARIEEQNKLDEEREKEKARKKAIAVGIIIIVAILPMYFLLSHYLKFDQLALRSFNCDKTAVNSTIALSVDHSSEVDSFCNNKCNGEYLEANLFIAISNFNCYCKNGQNFEYDTRTKQQISSEEVKCRVDYLESLQRR